MSLSGGPLDTGDLMGLAGRRGPRRTRRRVPPGEAVRASLVALVSTIVILGGLAYFITSSPSWPDVQEAFFSPTWFAYSLPKVIEAFGTNIALFVIAELLILPLALVLAILRGLPGPVFFPLRLIATLYVDFFRAVPGLLIIAILGFGIPALDLPGVPGDEFFWAVIALTLVYSAYVSEVYRAGIESIHWSQEAA